MIRALAILLLCQLAGTILQQALGLPLPGPVLGLVMLLAWFIRTGGPDAEMHHTATGLLKYLGLLFVPAGVGVVSELTPLRQNAGAILLAIPLSTIIALLVTGTLMSLFLRNQPRA